MIHAIVSSIFKAACRPPRRLAYNPCTDTKLPEVQRAEAEPLLTDQVEALRVAMGDLGVIVTLGVGSGMRQGECLGLTLDRVNFLRRTVYVDRQLVTVAGREPFLAPPKSTAAIRTIPLPRFVVEALSRHVGENEIPDGGFLFTIGGKPIGRSAFGHLWRPAVEKAGLPKGTGFHRPRHTADRRERIGQGRSEAGRAQERDDHAGRLRASVARRRGPDEGCARLSLRGSY